MNLLDILGLFYLKSTNSFICSRITFMCSIYKSNNCFFIHTLIHFSFNKYFLGYCCSVRTVLGTVHLLMDKANMFITILFVNFTSVKSYVCVGVGGKINTFTSLMEIIDNLSTNSL